MDGRTVVADENYLRESIVNPQAKVVPATSRSCRPSRAGERGNLMQLIAYIKSLEAPAGPGAAAAAPAPGGQGARTVMTTALRTHPELPQRPARHRSWLLTKDHKRIAMLYLISITVFFASAACSRWDPTELLTPQGDLIGRDLQQALHDARRRDDLLLPDPVDPGVLGQLPDADHDRRQGPRVPAHQPAELVHLRHRRPVHASAAFIAGGVDTGWTFYTPYSTTASNTTCARGDGRVHHRVLVDPHRPQLHRHDPPDARARA
jgi:hypothetical protein